MKYTMKKTIAFLLTLVMLVNILPVSVLAEQPAEGISPADNTLPHRSLHPLFQPDEIRELPGLPQKGIQRHHRPVPIMDAGEFLCGPRKHRPEHGERTGMVPAVGRLLQ